MHFILQLPIYVNNNIYVDPPIVGGRHIVLLLLASKFFLVESFLFPRSLSFDFCYNLDIWAQGKAVRAFLL